MPKSLKVVCLGGGLGAPTVMSGMRAHTDELGLASVGVEVGARGEIAINGSCRTSNERISAGRLGAATTARPEG